MYDVTVGDLLSHIGLRLSNCGEALSKDRSPDIIDHHLQTPVLRRTAFALHSTVVAIKRRTFPGAYGATNQLAPISKPTTCQRCLPAFVRAGASGVVLRSWCCPWELACRRCGTLFGQQAVRARAEPELGILPGLELDARRGSTMIWKYIERSWAGPFPPDTVIELLKLPVQGTKRSRALDCIVPETHAIDRTEPSLTSKSPINRAGLLAGIARFNDDPKSWMNRIHSRLTEQGKHQLGQIRSRLPFSTFPTSGEHHSGCPLSASAYHVAEHQLCLKLAANVRQIEQARRELGAFTSNLRIESHN